MTSNVRRYWRKHLVWFLLFASLLVNVTYFTYAPRFFYSFSVHNLETRAASVESPPAPAMCSRTYLGVSDIISMSKFSATCSVGRLTRLSGGESLKADGSIWGSLGDIAKSPQGSASACPRELKVADFPIPRTALVSFPGSGNTWTRHLAQQLTGIHSGNVYENSSITTKGFPYEGVIDNMIFVKSHRPPESDGSIEKMRSGKMVKIKFDRLFILLRSPYAAFMAEFKRSRLRLGKVGNGVIDPWSDKWADFVAKWSKNWARFVAKSFNTTLPSLVIYYEDLQSCLLPELVKMSLFFRSRELNEFAYCCTIKEHEGSYHRPPSNQTIEDAYPSRLRAILNGAIREAASAIKKLYPEAAKKVMGYFVLP